MSLEVNELRSRIGAPAKRNVINTAIAQQNRIKFHVETTLWDTLAQPTSEFLNYVSNLIPEDKFITFKTLFRYPVKTSELTGICFDKLSRIFEGRNPAFNYQFVSSEFRDDWERYRKKVLGEPQIWENKGWEYFKTEINSVLIVDVAERQEGEKPAPYFYWLPISKVIDYDKTIEGNIDWIAFRQDGNRIVVIDSESYRVFTEHKGNIGSLLLENKHDLGYCPAKFFWNESLSLGNPDVKKSPITKELESLDWFLFFYISKRHLDIHGAYPIYSGYESSCDYSNENGDYCAGGFIKDIQGNYKIDGTGALMRCPKCGKGSIAGAGSFVKVPIPSAEQPDLRNPVQMLTVDRDSLEYNVEEVERLKNEIITSIVGTAEDAQGKQAINEQQVKATFESQTTVLTRIKKGFEEAQTFVDSTVCKLRYGEAFVSANVNYGTEFYIFDVGELRRRYKEAKESGASEGELDALQRQIVETEYRNNPTQVERMNILNELEPYRHLTRSEALDLFRQGLISEQDLKVKLNFANLINRFERENTNILEFGSKIPFDRKINIISTKLIDYVS